MKSTASLLSGEVDILVGTQLLAKGLDLPRLGLVGIVSAESSLTLPDYTAEERTFQLLYQVIGRVGPRPRQGQGGYPDLRTGQHRHPIGRGPRLSNSFTKHRLLGAPGLPLPAVQLSAEAGRAAGDRQGRPGRPAERLKRELSAAGLPVEIIGPTPAFYARRGRYFYYQLVAKSKDRDHLLAAHQTSARRLADRPGPGRPALDLTH